MVKETYTIEELPDGTQVKYLRFKVPMMSERDKVFTLKKELMPDGSLFFSSATIEHPKCPVRPGVVRMYACISHLVQKSTEIEGAYNYTEFEDIDMKGYFPARLMNMIGASTIKTNLGKCYNHIRLDKK